MEWRSKCLAAFCRGFFYQPINITLAEITIKKLSCQTLQCSANHTCAASKSTGPDSPRSFSGSLRLFAQSRFNRALDGFLHIAFRDLVCRILPGALNDGGKLSGCVHVAGLVRIDECRFELLKSGHYWAPPYF